MPNAFSNLLLSRLPERELDLLRPHFVPFILKKGDVLTGPRGDDSVYFVEAGVIAVLVRTTGRESVTVAVTGREGVGGVVSVLGTPVVHHQLLVLVPGSAFCVDGVVLRSLRTSLPRTLDLTQRYVQVLVAEIAQSAICNRYHLGRERLARWLLETADRAAMKELPLTHDVLAQMVGGARSLVTVALSELREQNAIDYQRSSVRIMRRELTKHACACYGRMKGILAAHLAS